MEGGSQEPPPFQQSCFKPAEGLPFQVLPLVSSSARYQDQGLFSEQTHLSALNADCFDILLNALRI